jgi:hypothetical protein
MNRLAMCVGVVVSLGISAAVAAPESAGTGKAVPWAENEVHAAVDPEKEQTVIDVNDRFLIKSAAAGDSTRVQFGVLDGARAKYGSCEAAGGIKDGEPKTTWVEVAYTRPDAAGMRRFTVSRTADFHDNERRYSFAAAGDGERATLEPGITVAFENGVLIYEQAVGPIGASGNTKALRLAYSLSDEFEEVTASVEMDRNMWMVGTSGGDAEAPIYTVNNKALLAHMVGSPGRELERAVVAGPLSGPGIGVMGDAYVLKVAGGVPPALIGDIEVSTVQQQRCIAFQCLVDIQCLNAGPSCICHDLSGGPSPGVCLI